MTTLLIVYIISLALCIYLQRKIYFVTGEIITTFLFFTFIPILNTVFAFVLVAIYITEADLGKGIAKKILFIKEDE